MKYTLAAVVTAIAVAIACSAYSSGASIDKVPIGTPVQVTRTDGGVVTGTLTGRDANTLHIEVGPTTREIPRGQIDTFAPTNVPTPPPLPPKARFREYTVKASTNLRVRLDTSLSSAGNHSGDPVNATLTEAVREDGVEIIPADSVLHGSVTSAEASGNVRGRASLSAHFNSIAIAGTSETYDLSTGFQHTAAATKGDDAKKIGIPAAGGALLGALLGGKKGALIGTVIGGGAGAAVVLTTSGPEVRYTRGAMLSLPLDQSIEVRVPIRK